MRSWFAALHLGQLLMLTSVLAVLSAGGLLVWLDSSGDRFACDSKREYADSLISNRQRLTAIDSYLVTVDWKELADPLELLKRLRRNDAKGPRTSDEAQFQLWTIDGNLAKMRLLGASPSEVSDYLERAESLHVVSKSAPSRSNSDAITARMTAAEQRFLTDTASITKLSAANSESSRYQFATMLQWHDTLSITRTISDLGRRCTSYRREMLFLVPMIFGTLIAMFLGWWWWFGGRINRASTP